MMIFNKNILSDEQGIISFLVDIFGLSYLFGQMHIGWSQLSLQRCNAFAFNSWYDLK